MLSLEQILNVNIGQKRCFFVHWKNKNKMNKWRAHVRNHITYFCDRLKELVVLHDFTQTCGHVIFFLLTYFSKQIVNWSDLSWWQSRKVNSKERPCIFDRIYLSRSPRNHYYISCVDSSLKNIYFLVRKCLNFIHFFRNRLSIGLIWVGGKLEKSTPKSVQVWFRPKILRSGENVSSSITDSIGKYPVAVQW